MGGDGKSRSPSFTNTKDVAILTLNGFNFSFLLFIRRVVGGFNTAAGIFPERPLN